MNKGAYFLSSFDFSSHGFFRYYVCIIISTLLTKNKISFHNCRSFLYFDFMIT